MTSLIVVGVNHRSAPVELRERFAIPDVELADYLAKIVERAGLREGMLISTCNRVELYGVTAEGVPAGERALRELVTMRGVTEDLAAGTTFVRAGEPAIRHIFRVAASLDSMVVGEPQILGQVKAALEMARQAGVVGPILDRCLTTALRGAKRARSETGLARGAASVPSVASDLARSIFGDLRGRGVLVIGAGEMAEQSAVHLRAAGASELVVVNRSPENGRRLAQRVDGRYEEWDRLEHQLGRVDVVVTSTGSQMPVIDRGLLRPVMKARRHEPLFLVDIAVPRDVEAAAGRLDHVFLYNIDDLQSIVHDNMRARAVEADRAGALVDEEVTAFGQWLRLRAVGPLIGTLQGRGQQIAEAEVERALRRLPDLSPDHRAAIEQLGHGIARKLLHAPVSRLRAASSEDGPAGPALADAVETLFNLAQDDELPEEPSPEGVPEPS